MHRHSTPPDPTPRLAGGWETLSYQERERQVMVAPTPACAFKGVSPPVKLSVDARLVNLQHVRSGTIGAFLPLPLAYGITLGLSCAILTCQQGVSRPWRIWNVWPHHPRTGLFLFSLSRMHTGMQPRKPGSNAEHRKFHARKEARQNPRRTCELRQIHLV